MKDHGRTFWNNFNLSTLTVVEFEESVLLVLAYRPTARHWRVGLTEYLTLAPVATLFTIIPNKSIIRSRPY